ncbi:MAG: hypothetical protein ACO3IN_13515 [Steroidobacteraceae bacterium]
MSHDPLCPAKPAEQLLPEQCWRCQLIAKVRAELQLDYERGYRHGWVEAVGMTLDAMNAATDGRNKTVGFRKAEEAVRQLLDEARMP